MKTFLVSFPPDTEIEVLQTSVIFPETLLVCTYKLTGVDELKSPENTLTSTVMNCLAALLYEM